MLGWAGTALAWALSSGSNAGSEAATGRSVAASELVASRGSRDPRARRAPPRHRLPFHAEPDQASHDVDALREEVREELVTEIEHERARRRQQRSERHLSRLLDEVSGFAEEYGLDSDTQAALESSLAAMHDTLEANRPDGPPGPEGPPPEVMEVLEEAFGQFVHEVGEALDDPELADVFADRMTPRPLRS